MHDEKLLIQLQMENTTICRIKLIDDITAWPVNKVDPHWIYYLVCASFLSYNTVHCSTYGAWTLFNFTELETKISPRHWILRSCSKQIPLPPTHFSYGFLSKLFWNVYGNGIRFNDIKSIILQVMFMSYGTTLNFH